MGSSLRVTPAADIPVETYNNGGQLVIVNLQKTPLNNIAALNIFAKCDEVMRRLFKKMDLQIPVFSLQRKVEFSMQLKDNEYFLHVRGVDEEGGPYSLFPQVELKKDKGPSEVLKKEPFRFNLKGNPPAKVRVVLHFEGHYSEPPNQIELETADLKRTTYLMVFNPVSKTWELTVPVE